MTDSQDERPSMEALEGRRRRNNVRLAWAHVVLAVGFLLAFVWVQIHK